MNLDFFNDIKNNFEKSSKKDFIGKQQGSGDLTQGFSCAVGQVLINDLSNFLNKPSKENKEVDLEDGLYQVVDFGNNSVFLQNTDTNEVFEEKNLPEEIKNNISNDYVLRYENGNCTVDKELTDKFMNSIIGIREFREIKNNFLEKSGIKDISANEKFKILTRSEEDNYTILYYGENKSNTIEVPNALLPFFANESKTFSFNYESGKFESV